MEDLGVLTTPPTAQPVEDSFSMDALGPTAQLVEDNLPVDSLDSVTTQPTVVQFVPAPEAPVTVQRRRPQHYLAITLSIFILCLLVSPATIICSIPAVILSAVVSIHSGRQIPNQPLKY